MLPLLVNIMGGTKVFRCTFSSQPKGSTRSPWPGATMRKTGRTVCRTGRRFTRDVAR